MLTVGTAHAAVHEYEQFNDLSGFSYTQDRTPPSTVDVQNFGGDSRLHFGIVGQDAAGDSWHRYEGINHVVNMPEQAYQSFSVDMYIGSDWASRSINAGMWAQGNDALGKVSAWPILTFKNGAETAAGFYTYDYINGGWNEARLATSTDFGGWHNLRFDLIQGSGVEYFVDDVSMGLFADDLTFDLASVILNTYNFGENEVRDYYFDNFTAQATPIPGAIWLLGSGLVGLVGLRRKSKA